ncbi:MAG: MATE family efflux transporter, partial [Marinilabiliaceae bacterium]|nr:MATE family efflux transporter [Marinilabiliaceae bacterium]
MRDLTVGNEAKLIFNFAVPLVFGNLFQQLYHVVDSIIVGNKLGKEALAAVGASSPIFYALIAFIIGIGSGATVVISQYFGAKDLEKVKRAIDTIFIFLFVASIITTAIGITYSEEIFRFLHVEEKVIPMATQYFNVFMMGMVAFFGFSATSSVLRGLGDSMTPLVFMIIATVINIALDLLFIVQFKWGIEGVAWATVIAQGIAFISGAIYLTHRHQIISFKITEFKFDRAIFKQSLKIGLPTGFQQTFVALGLMALIRIVNNFDTNVLAAFSVASRIDSLAAMPSLNLASALAAFVGQNLGAGKIERIRKGLRATLVMSWCISLAVMTGVIFFGQYIMGVFIQDAEVIHHGTNYLVIVSSFYLIFSTMFVMHGVLRGAGDTLIPMFITLFSLWIIRIPFAVFL